MQNLAVDLLFFLPHHDDGQSQPELPLLLLLAALDFGADVVAADTAAGDWEGAEEAGGSAVVEAAPL